MVILTSIQYQHGHGGLDGAGASIVAGVEASVEAGVGGGGDRAGMVGGKFGFS